jgi:hypothetical protein
LLLNAALGECLRLVAAANESDILGLNRERGVQRRVNAPPLGRDHHVAGAGFGDRQRVALDPPVDLREDR